MTDGITSAKLLALMARIAKGIEDVVEELAALNDIFEDDEPA